MHPSFFFVIAVIILTILLNCFQMTSILRIEYVILNTRIVFSIWERRTTTDDERQGKADTGVDAGGDAVLFPACFA